MTKRKCLALSILTALFVFLAVPAAQAFPEGAKPKVTCDTLSIDPATWISVTFSGTVNGVPYSKKVSYGGEQPHLAIAHISDLTTGTGPLKIISTATGPFLGTSLTTTVTITCHESPTTTTASTSTTTAASTTTTTVMPTTTTVCVQPRGCCLADCNGPPLPRTGGSTSGPLALASVLILGGLTLVAKARRK